MKIALIQMTVTDNKSQNIAHAKEMLDESGRNGAKIAILPEMFCIRYENKLFLPNAENAEGGECFRMLQSAAKANEMCIVGGSIPELADGKLFNTSMAFSDTGEFLGKYRKAHLFDVDIDGFRFMESETICKGDTQPLVLNDFPITTGVSICFDVRFPEWSRKMMLSGVGLIALPAAFSVKTGPLHWELLLRTRALDNQCYFAGVAPAASPSSYGHTMLAAPNGSILAACGDDEEILYAEISQVDVELARKSIPIYNARRTDLY